MDFQTLIFDPSGIGDQLFFPLCFIQLYVQLNTINRVSRIKIRHALFPLGFGFEIKRKYKGYVQKSQDTNS